MRWLEVVNLCACDDAAMEYLLGTSAGSHLDAIRELPTCHDVVVLRQPDVTGTFVLAVTWFGAGPPRKSREVLALVDCLGRYGLVNHTVWSEFDVSSMSGKEQK